MEDIYILSKQVNEKILNLIKIKKKKEQIYFEESKKENNKQYNKNIISILKYYIKNIKKEKIFGNLFVKENKKKCRIIINNKKKKIKKLYNN